jgi:hypothetical protein
MNSRLIFIAMAVAAASIGLALPGGASAAARSGVTIHHYYGGGVIGEVFSQKPERCASLRKVQLFKQTGTKQNPNRDTKVGMTHASKKAQPNNGNGGYGWEVQYHRAHPGDYYARIPAKSGCQADNSKTIHIAARPQTKIADWSANESPRSADFRYTAVGGIVPYNFRCRLDDQQYRRCPKSGGRSGQEGTKYYHDLSRGRHVFKVYAIGGNGKSDRTPVKQAFRIKG